MADTVLTLADLATINNKNLSGQIADELLEGAPVVMQLAADVASNDTTHQWLRYDGPASPGFRDMNDGREHQQTTDTNVTIDMKIFDGSHTADVATAEAYRYGTAAWLQREGLRHLRTGFAKLEQQVFQGVGFDATGFDGLPDELSALANKMVISAGGASAGACTSCYLIRSSLSDIAMITGKNGNISVGESRIQRVAGTTGWYPAYFTPVTAWYAMQFGSTFSAARIANLDATATLDDDLISQAIQLFPADRPPTMICMNRQSLGQLQQSRTATNPTGAPAPFPESAFKLPIIVTDQIANTEAVVA